LHGLSKRLIVSVVASFGQVMYMYSTG